MASNRCRKIDVLRPFFASVWCKRVPKMPQRSRGRLFSEPPSLHQWINYNSISAPQLSATPCHCSSSKLSDFSGLKFRIALYNDRPMCKKNTFPTTSTAPQPLPETFSLSGHVRGVAEYKRKVDKAAPFSLYGEPWPPYLYI